MSYRLTEAERKHVAAIEDQKFEIVAKHVAGSTPSLHLKFTDDDKLNHDVELPSYQFVVRAQDDKVSKICLRDTVNNEEIECKGFDGKGVGWRYNITFGKEDGTDYVKSIKLIRENDGALIKELTFSKMTGLTFKTITVDDTANFKGDVSFEGKNVIVKDGTVLTVEGDANVNNFTTNDSQVKNLHVTDRAEFSGKDGEGLAKVVFTNTEISIDDSNDVDIAKAKIHDLESDGPANFSEANISQFNVIGKADIANLRVSGESSFEGNATFQSMEAGSAKVEHAAIQNGTTNVATIVDSLRTEEGSTSTFNGPVTANDSVKLSGKTTIADADITTENVSDSHITNAEIMKEKVGDSDIDNLNVDEEVANHIVVKNGIDSTLGNLIKGTGDDLSDPDSGKVVIGNGIERMVIKSAGYGDITDDNHYHIECEIDGKRTFLMTAEDAKELGLENLVDKTSNQTIKGIKQFTSPIYANDGVKARTHEGNDLSIVYRGIDLNDPNAIKDAYLMNEEYEKAREETEQYNGAVAEWSDAYVAAQKANAALEDQKRLYDEYKKAVDALHTAEAEAALKEKLIKKLDDLRAESEAAVGQKYDDLVAQLKIWVDEINRAGVESEIPYAENGTFTNAEGFKSPSAAVADSTLDTIDEVYNDAVATAAINDRAVSYLDDIDKIFSPENIKRLLSNIPGTYGEVFRTVENRDFPNARSFFEWVSSLKEDVPAEAKTKRFCEQSILFVLKDPLGKKCPIWEEKNAHVPGFYFNQGGGWHKLVTNILEDGTNTDATYLVKDFFYEAPNEHALKNPDGITKYGESLAKQFENVDEILASMDAAKDDFYSIPERVKNVKEAADAVRAAADTISLDDTRVFVDVDDTEDVLAAIRAALTDSEKELPEFASKDVQKAVNSLISDVQGLLSSSLPDTYGETTLLKNDGDIAKIREAAENLEIKIPSASAVEELAKQYADATQKQAEAIALYNELAKKYAKNEYMNDQNDFPFSYTEAKPGTKIIIDSITPVSASTTVEAYKNGNIAEKYVNPDAHTVMVVGNSKDELQLESAARADGDEHLIARVGGKLHEIAYLDDLGELVDFVNGPAELDGVPKSYGVNKDKKTGRVVLYVDSELKTVYSDAERADGKHGISTRPSENRPLLEFEAGPGIKIDQDANVVKISADDSSAFDIVSNGTKTESGFIDENGDYHQAVYEDSPIGYYDPDGQFHSSNEKGVDGPAGAVYGPNAEGQTTVHVIERSADGTDLGYHDENNVWHSLKDDGDTVKEIGGVYGPDGKYHPVTVIVDGKNPDGSDRIVYGYYDPNDGGQWHSTTEEGVKAAGGYIDQGGNFHHSEIDPVTGQIGYKDPTTGLWHTTAEPGVTTLVGGFYDGVDGAFHPAVKNDDGTLGYEDYVGGFHNYDETGVTPAGGFIDTNNGNAYHKAEVSGDGKSFGFHDDAGNWHSSNEDGVKYVIVGGGGFYDKNGDYHPAAIGPDTVGWKDGEGNFHSFDEGNGSYPIGGYYTVGDDGEYDYHVIDIAPDGTLGWTDEVGNFHRADDPLNPAIPAPTGVGGVAGIVDEKGQYHPAIIGLGASDEKGYYDRDGEFHSASEKGTKVGGSFYYSGDGASGQSYDAVKNADGTVGYISRKDGTFIPASTYGVTPANGFYDENGKFHYAQVSNDGTQFGYWDAPEEEGGKFHAIGDSDCQIAGGYYNEKTGAYYQAAYNPETNEMGYWDEKRKKWHPASEAGTIPAGINGFFVPGEGFKPSTTDGKTNTLGYIGSDGSFHSAKDEGLTAVSGFYDDDGFYRPAAWNPQNTSEIGYFDDNGFFHAVTEADTKGNSGKVAPAGPNGTTGIFTTNSNGGAGEYHPAVLGGADGTTVGYIDRKGQFHPVTEDGLIAAKTSEPGFYKSGDGNYYPATTKQIDVIGYENPQTGAFVPLDSDKDKTVRAVSGGFYDENGDLYPAALGPDVNNQNTVGFYTPDGKFHAANEHGVKPTENTDGFTDPNGTFYPATTNESGAVGYYDKDKNFVPAGTPGTTVNNTDNGHGATGTGDTNEIVFGNNNTKFSFISSHDDIRLNLTSDKKVDLNLKHIYTGDLYQKADIIRKYNNLSEVPAHSKELAKALDVAVIRDELTQIARETRTAVDVRLPSAPKDTGSYILNAVTLASEPDENGEVKVTTKYAWNGALTLPDTGITARDDRGELLQVTEDPDNPVEYTLKLRLVKRRTNYVDGTFKEERVPILTWSRII